MARDRIGSELRTFAGFLGGLPRFLSSRMVEPEARAIVAHRLRHRPEHLVTAVQQAVFANPRSPYRPLFDLAGCQLGDVKRLVEQDGVEGALGQLRAAGIYVSFEEFKGQRPIRRGSQEIDSDPDRFDNPTFRNYYHITTGGSTGRGRRVLLDLEFLAARVPIYLLADVVYGTLNVPTGYWFEIPPGNGLDSILVRVPAGTVPERWFTPIQGGGDGASWRFSLATKAIVARARWAGFPVPYPEHVPLDQAHVIAKWLGQRLKERGRVCFRSHVSKIVRIAVAARELALDLSGAVLTGGGEPPTPAKVRQITATGASFNSNYHFVEAGPVGMMCPAGDDPNDQHFFKDHLALIQGEKDVPGFETTVAAFYYTTLLPSAPKFLLNVESDDYGVVGTRSCGCPWESLGFTDHIRGIRSFRKLTGEGVTLIGSEMETILEEDLPARFGGTPLDYQLVEEEDGQGFTKLTLLIAPHLTIPDPAVVVAAVLEALRRRGAAGSMSGSIWKQAGTLRVRRERPRVTGRGKQMSLQGRRPPSAEVAP